MNTKGGVNLRWSVLVSGLFVLFVVGSLSSGCFAHGLVMTWSVDSVPNKTIRLHAEYQPSGQGDLLLGHYVYFPYPTILAHDTWTVSPFPQAYVNEWIVQVPVSGTYQWRCFVTDWNTSGGITKDVQVTIDWSNPPVGTQNPGVPNPPPDPTGANGSWWDWLRKLFTMDVTHQNTWKSMIQSWRTCGPWGQAALITSGFNSNGALAQEKAETMTLNFGGVRHAGGEPRVGPVLSVDNFALPLHDFEMSHPAPGADGLSPWMGVTTLNGWLGTMRTVLGWCVWVMFGIGFLIWSRGRVQV